jgi:hypothetical protein
MMVGWLDECMDHDDDDGGREGWMNELMIG